MDEQIDDALQYAIDRITESKNDTEIHGILVDFCDTMALNATRREAALVKALDRYSSSLGDKFFDKCVFADDEPELCRTHNYDPWCPVSTLQEALEAYKGDKSDE